MAYPITVGDLREKSKTDNPTDDLYRAEIPILLDGNEISFVAISIRIPDGMTRAQVLAAVSNGFVVEFGI